MDKIKHIPVLLFAGSQDRPDAFAPEPAGVAACSLCDTAVYHSMANTSATKMFCC